MWRVLWLVISFIAQGAMAQGMRFTPPISLVDVGASVAQPGNVPVPLSSANINLEIVNWSTALTPTPERGEFLLKLKGAVPIGSILVYASGEVSAGENGRLTKLASMSEARKLRVLGLGLDPIDSIKISAPPEKQPGNAGFRATIPFLTLLPVRATNIAASADVTASSGNAKLLVDGVADENQTVLVDGGGSNAWIRLAWKEPQAIRGIALFGGRDLTPIEELSLEFSANGSFRLIDGRPTEPGVFRRNTLFVTYEPVTTREIRIRRPEKQKPITLGEIVVLQELPKPGASASADKKHDNN